mgnify:CR=1 FL=1
MTEQEQIQQLNKLLLQEYESEIVEFKEAKENYDFSDLGKYFSALSNEANLKHTENAWLVLGVEDKSHKSEYLKNGLSIKIKFRRN